MVPLGQSSPPKLTMRSIITSRKLVHSTLSFRVICASNNNGKEPPKPPTDQQIRTIFGWKGFKRWQADPEMEGPSSFLRQWQSTNFLLGDAEHKELVQKAAGTPSLSFGFSAGGCLFPYYIGAAAALKDANVLSKASPLGGASAGAIMATCIGSGMDLDDVTKHCMDLMDDCRKNGTRGRLGPVLEAFLQDRLPKDAHKQCNDKVHIAVTAAFPYIKPKLVSRFHDRDDLIRAVMTSCHIPYWLDNRPVTEFRGTMHLDGGLTNFIPVPPNTVGVRLCCFPSKQVNPYYRIGISPDTFDNTWPYSLSQMVSWAFEPADEDIVVYLIDKGKKDAEAWMETMELKSAAEVVEGKQERKEGEVAAAKETAAGSEKKEEQEEKKERGGEKLKEKAVEGEERKRSADEQPAPV